MQPNLADAARFIELLAGGGSVTFQTFDDRKIGRRLSKVLHGQLPSHEATLSRLNDQGAGVFVMVNTGDLKGRKTENVRTVRASFVDLDGAPLEPVNHAPIKPHLTVESSQGRYHAYWRVDGIELREFRAVQETLAHRFGGDPKVQDLPRVMRLPGFWHRKSEPFLTRIIAAEDAPSYRRDEFLSSFNIDPSVSWAESIPEGQRNDRLFRMGLGFKNKGYGPEAIMSRLIKVNASKCDPPLPDAEVMEIVESIMKYAPDGALTLPFSLLDSPRFLSLSSSARDLSLQIFRRCMGKPGTVTSMIPRDFAKCGFGNPRTLRRYRDELIDAGFLTEVRPPAYGKKGEKRECALFRFEDFYGKSCHKKG